MLGGAGALVRSHSLSVFEGTTIVEIGGDTCGAKGVIADRRWNAGVPCTALKNAPGIGLAHRAIRQKPGAPEGRAKKWTLAIVGEAGGLNVILQISLKMMVTRHAMFLATFFVQTDPQSAVLPVDVRDSHTQRRTDAGEGENEKADQRTVAEADHGCGVDAVEELARFRRRQYGGLAGARPRAKPSTLRKSRSIADTVTN